MDRRDRPLAVRDRDFGQDGDAPRTWALAVGDEFRHEGILGTVFTGRVEEEAKIGGYHAIVPSITGQAWITGFASYVVDHTDPFPDGFTVGDIW